MVWMKVEPFWKPPRMPTMTKVAPVSEIDLEKARMKPAMSEGLMVGKVTVLDAVNGGAPSVLEAFSSSFL